MRMNGLYPGRATAPGWNFVSGKPFGPGVATRSGLKSGAPSNRTSAWPNGFSVGVGLSSVTVCTHFGQPIARFKLRREVDVEVVCRADVGCIEDREPHRLAVRDALVERDAHGLGAQVDVDRALQRQLRA